MKQIEEQLTRQIIEKLSEQANKQIEKLVADFRAELQTKAKDLVMSAAQSIKYNIQATGMDTMNPQIHIHISL